MVASTEGIEPFDEGLDRHIWSLSDQRLQWNGEIARKRREKPREVHRLMKELLETQQAVDEMESEEYEAVELPESQQEPDRTYSWYAVFDCVALTCVTVPEETYENINETMRKTFSIAEELQQVSISAIRGPKLKLNIWYRTCVCSTNVWSGSRSSRPRSKL